MLTSISAFGAGPNKRSRAADPDFSKSTLEIIKNGSIANGIDENIVRAVIVDANNVPLPNVKVTFALPGGITQSWLTGADGTYSYSFGSFTVGDVPVSITIADKPQKKTVTTYFQADVPTVDAPTTEVIPVKTTAVANGTDKNQLRAHVTDMYGNPIKSQAVRFTIVSGTAQFSNGSTVFDGTTDLFGDLPVTLTSLVAGKVTIIATLNGTPFKFGSPVDVFFIADQPSTSNPATVIVTVDPEATADNVDRASVKVHVVDANGNPVPNAIVKFTKNSGEAEFDPAGSEITTTNASGDAFVYLISKKAGDVVISATVNGAAVVNPGPTVTVKFVAGPPDFTVSTTRLFVLDNYALADNTARDRVRARVTDKYGNFIGGLPVTFVIESGTATPVGNPQVSTNSNGNAYLYYTSNVVGEVRVRAFINGNEITNNSPAIIYFKADVPSTTHPDTRLYADDDEAVANGADQTILRAHIVDQYGHPVKDAEVTFTITGGTAGSTGKFDIITGKATTDDNGNAIIKVTNTVTGTVEVTATVGGSTVTGSPKQVKFVPDAPDPGHAGTRLVVVDGEAKANGTDLASVKAIVVDANGNLVPDADVQFIIVNSTDAKFNPVTSGLVKTGPNGEALITISSTVAGEVEIRATINGQPVGNTVKVKFVPDNPDVSNPNTTLLPGDPEAVADNTDFATVKARVVDANGNPVAGQLVVFSIGPNGSSTAAKLEPVNGQAYTNANGEAEIRIKSPMAGTAEILASVNGNPITHGSPQTVTFVNGPPDNTKPGTYLRVKQNYAKANGTDVNIVEAYVVDANGNPVNDVVITFKRNGQAVFQTPPAQTLTGGWAEVLLSSTVAGEVEITATVGGVDILNGSPAKIYFVADDPEPANPLTTLLPVVKKAPANGTATTSVKAHIVDANGNPVKDKDVEFFWTGDAQAKDNKSIIKTNEDGDAIIEFTSTVVGTVTVTAKVDGKPIVNPLPSQDVEFIADNPSTTDPDTKLIVKTTGAVANYTDLNVVQAHVEDEHGHPVPGVRVDFAFDKTAVAFEGDGFGITDANGNVEVRLKSKVAGIVNVTASIGADPIVNGSPAQVEFVAGEPNAAHADTKLFVVIEKAAADDKALTKVGAHVVDEYGNPVPNATVKFAILSGTASFADGPSVTTDANGDAFVTLHSAVIGQVQLTADIIAATVMPITHASPATVEFILGTPANDHPDTYIKVIDNNAKANGTALNKVKVKVVDAGGHPIQGATIVFTKTSGEATIVEQGPILTDANGEAFITLYSTVAGEVHITAKADGVDILNGSPAIAIFTAGDPDNTNKATLLEVLTDKALADGKATNSVRVHVADFYGNAVKNVPVEFFLANGTATIVEAGPFVTDDKGEVTITLTSTVGGTVEVRAKAAGQDVLKENPAILTFVTEPDVTVEDTKLVVVTNNAIADGIETNSVKAHVVDANGNPLNMKEVFFRIESGDATVLTVQPVLTDANGEATILLASKTAGQVSVTAKVSDKPIVFGSPAKLRFVPIDIYVPKVFTPNNDGKNDVVKPIVVGLNTFHYFSIYNRWGNLLFTTKDPNAGWDGRFKGVLQPVETYMWIAEGLDQDKKKIVRRGMISLVR